MKHYSKHELIRIVTRALKKIDAAAALYAPTISNPGGWLPADYVLNVLLPVRRLIREGQSKSAERKTVSEVLAEDPDKDTFGKVHFVLPTETFAPPCVTEIPGPEAARQ